VDWLAEAYGELARRRSFMWGPNWLLTLSRRELGSPESRLTLRGVYVSAVGEMMEATLMPPGECRECDGRHVLMGEGVFSVDDW
jgi:hypothetical protein